MEGSHSSTIYLNPDILKANHAALSSPTHHDTPHTNEEDPNDRREIMLRINKFTPCDYYPMNIDDLYSNISELGKSDSFVNDQDNPIKAMPIMKEVSLPFPHISVLGNTQPTILGTCLNNITLQDVHEESQKE